MGVGIFLSVAYLLCDGMIMSFSDDFMWWIFFFLIFIFTSLVQASFSSLLISLFLFFW